MWLRITAARSLRWEQRPSEREVCGAQATQGIREGSATSIRMNFFFQTKRRMEWGRVGLFASSCNNSEERSKHVQLWREGKEEKGLGEKVPMTADTSDSAPSLQ